MATKSIYRAVADYLTDMVTSIQQAGSKITDFSAGSVARSLFEAVAASLSLQSLTADQLRQDMFIATATGQALDDKAADFQVPRLPSVQAAGTIRVTQVTPGSTIFLPAGWGQLSTISTGPTTPPVSFITTADATLPMGIATVDIPAQAVQGGVAGNIAAGVVLVPGSPINGIVSNGGFTVTPGPGFQNGVDVETDDAFRARIPIVVQGRVKGRAESFLAAAMSVPGVLGASVVPAGTFDGSITVPGGTVEVFYSGAAGLASAVDAACQAASVLDQNVVTALATTDRIVCHCTLTVPAGTDSVGVTLNALAAVQGVVNNVIPGGTAYYSSAIQALHNVDQVIAVNVPLTDFRRFTEGGGTTHDIAEPPNTYPTLAAADFTAAINFI